MWNKSNIENSFKIIIINFEVFFDFRRAFSEFFLLLELFNI